MFSGVPCFSEIVTFLSVEFVHKMLKSEPATIVSAEVGAVISRAARRDNCNVDAWVRCSKREAMNIWRSLGVHIVQERNEYTKVGRGGGSCSVYTHMNLHFYKLYYCLQPLGLRASVPMILVVETMGI